MGHDKSFFSFLPVSARGAAGARGGRVPINQRRRRQWRRSWKGERAMDQKLTFPLPPPLSIRLYYYLLQKSPLGISELGKKTRRESERSIDVCSDVRNFLPLSLSRERATEVGETGYGSFGFAFRGGCGGEIEKRASFVRPFCYGKGAFSLLLLVVLGVILAPAEDQRVKFGTARGVGRPGKRRTPTFLPHFPRKKRRRRQWPEKSDCCKNVKRKAGKT